MTIQSGFFNSINGDRRYDANWFSAYFASFIGNGVFPNPSTGLQVVEGNNMNIVVKAGKGWINGYFVVNDGDYTLTLDNADGVLKRIDRVVMRLNYLTRQIEIDVKKGAFASNPVAPTLQRDADMHELALADILINNGATTIKQSNITDTRFNADLCGIVKGLIDEIDTTNLFAQYNDTFESWFESLETILEGDVATSLANQIVNHESHDNQSAHLIENITGLTDELAKLNYTETQSALNYYVDVNNGDDNNDGSSSQTAFKTINKAIKMLPRKISHLTYIYIANGNYDEDIKLIGFDVSDAFLNIKGISSDSVTVKKISVFGAIKAYIGDIACTNIEVRTGASVSFDGIKTTSYLGANIEGGQASFYRNSVILGGIRANFGSVVNVLNTTINTASGGTGLTASLFSNIYLENVTNNGDVKTSVSKGGVILP